MTIVRAVQLADLDQLWELLGHATYGLTTLQINKEQLSERVEHSHFAFTRKTEKPTGEPYVFVMEVTSSGQLVGLSCIFSKTGGYEPFYSYARVTESSYCEVLNKVQEVESLHLQKIHDGPTEIGSLFLLPEYRGQGRGRLLSLARFSFMSAYPKRFADQVIAEMRGVMNDDGHCPFWEAIGRHFFDMDFPQADNLSTLNKRFIEDLMPRYPIYTSLLAASARTSLGDVHPLTRPALAMLQAEGFEKTNMIDIFDGGPVVRCPRPAIDAVRRTQVGSLLRIETQVSGPAQIVASLQNGFRATIANVQVAATGMLLSRHTADLLHLAVGDQLLTTSLHPTPGR
ncbi:MAG: arginine N-succinyltransferase [Aureliella sp.]